MNTKQYIVNRFCLLMASTNEFGTEFVSIMANILNWLNVVEVNH